MWIAISLGSLLLRWAVDGASMAGFNQRSHRLLYHDGCVMDWCCVSLSTVQEVYQRVILLEES